MRAFLRLLIGIRKGTPIHQHGGNSVSFKGSTEFPFIQVLFTIFEQSFPLESCGQSGTPLFSEGKVRSGTDAWAPLVALRPHAPGPRPARDYGCRRALVPSPNRLCVPASLRRRYEGRNVLSYLPLLFLDLSSLLPPSRLLASELGGRSSVMTEMSIAPSSTTAGRAGRSGGRGRRGGGRAAGRNVGWGPGRRAGEDFR